MKICERCLKEVKKDDDYYELKLRLKGKIVSKKYIHNNCHKNMEQQSKQMLAMAQGLMGQTEGIMEKLNINKKVVIT